MCQPYICTNLLLNLQIGRVQLYETWGYYAFYNIIFPTHPRCWCCRTAWRPLGGPPPGGTVGWGPWAVLSPSVRARVAGSVSGRFDALFELRLSNCVRLTSSGTAHAGMHGLAGAGARGGMERPARAHITIITDHAHSKLKI